MPVQAASLLDFHPAKNIAGGSFGNVMKQRHTNFHNRHIVQFNSDINSGSQLTFWLVLLWIIS
jgi:hypothetical protein